MSGLRCRVLKASLDVIGLQVRIVRDDLGLRSTGGKQREHVSNTHAGVPDRWTTMHNL